MADPIMLSRFPLHLGLGATTAVQPEFTGEMDWYEGYGERHGSDGAEGRLVTSHTFSNSWDVWEMHPVGSELVLCLSGEITLVQEVDGMEEQTVLHTGELAINEPGVWHTADVAGPVTCLFITAGMGTEHRPR